MVKTYIYLCLIPVLALFMVQLTLENKRNNFLLREPLSQRRSVTSQTIGTLIYASAKISKLACIFSVKIT